MQKMRFLLSILVAKALGQKSYKTDTLYFRNSIIKEDNVWKKFFFFNSLAQPLFILKRRQMNRIVLTQALVKCVTSTRPKESKQQRTESILSTLMVCYPKSPLMHFSVRCWQGVNQVSVPAGKYRILTGTLAWTAKGAGLHTLGSGHWPHSWDTHNRSFHCISCLVYA